MLRRPRSPRPLRPAERTVRTLGAAARYQEAGTGRPTLLLHAGLGASSIWEPIVPTIAAHGRILALDLVGTGGSDRLEPESQSSYRLSQLEAHLDAFLELTGVREPVTLVVLGLASMVALHWAARFPERVRAVCIMESIAEPWTSEVIPDDLRPILDRARSADGTRYGVYSDDLFRDAMRTQLLYPPDATTVERFRVARGLVPERRRLQLSLLEQIPIDGEPHDSFARVSRYAEWLRGSTVPKLLVAGRPGHVLSGPLADSARTLPNLEVGEVKGVHLLPIDSPNGVATHLSAWLRRLGR